MAESIVAGCIIISDKKEILLLRRTSGIYDIPSEKADSVAFKDPKNPDLVALQKVALIGVFENLGNDIRLDQMFFFRNSEWVEDGKKINSYKFITRIISGSPMLNNPTLYEGISWISSERLSSLRLSPDLDAIKQDLQKILCK